MRSKNFEQRFEEFHAENPHVYKELLRLTRLAKSRGATKIGIRMLWEVTRWNLTIDTKDPNSKFKLNDHYHSRYVRLIAKKHPNLEPLFEFRTLRTE